MKMQSIDYSLNILVRKELNIERIDTLIVSLRNQTLLPRLGDMILEVNAAETSRKFKDSSTVLSLEYVWIMLF